MLPLTAATSFEHRRPQCLLTLTRSTSPPPSSIPCACVLVSPLYYKPSMNHMHMNTITYPPPKDCRGTPKLGKR